MALIDEVVKRFSNDLLAKLTNIDLQTLTSPNLTFLQTVCDDVQFGEFEAFLNETFDVTLQSRWHLNFAVLLVKLKCIEYGASADETAKEIRTRVEGLAKSLREIHARDRVSPQSSSDLTPSVHSGEGPFRPQFDDIFFERMTPEDTSSDRDPVTGFPLP
jgi:hypothetical protein